MRVTASSDATMKKTVVITGANRGLGLALCQHYLLKGWAVIACCREPALALSLCALRSAYKDLEIHALDVRDLERIDALALTLKERAVDLLISNAGVFGDAQGVSDTPNEAFMETFVVNTLAPIRLAEAFLPNLLKGQDRLLVAMSSWLGSIEDNTEGGYLPYRTTKAALNAAMKSLAIDWRPLGIKVLILHPGWVRTDMGGPKAPLSVIESVEGMVRVISDFKTLDTGAFLNYRGETLSW
jgi:NAD(P)-dependent dehydrogenase (short-subunit alcohol dehydrogenase family)